MPYGLAGKTGVMLLSRNVRASVPKYICLFRVSFKLSKNGDNRPSYSENGCPLFMVSQNRCRDDVTRKWRSIARDPED